MSVSTFFDAVYLLVYFLILSHSGHSQTIVRSTANSYSNVTCDESETSCTVACSKQYSCPESIFCPSSSSCDSCTITCSADYACFGVTIYSFDCTTVSISTDSNYGLASATIYAPDSSGSLTVTSDSGDYGLYQANVYDATNTDTITIDCYDRTYEDTGDGYAPNANNECMENYVDARSSDFLVFRCNSDAECGNNVFYCPKNYNGYFINSCQVSASDCEIYGNEYRAINGYPIVS